MPEDFEDLVVSKQDLKEIYLGDRKEDLIYVTRYKLKNLEGFYYKIDIYYLPSNREQRIENYSYRGSTGYQANNLKELKESIKNKLL